MKFLAEEVATYIGACLVPVKNFNEDLPLISDYQSTQNAKAGEVVFVSKKKYLPELKKTQASYAIIPSKYAKYAPCHCFITEQPRVSFAKLTKLFSYRNTEEIQGQSIHPKSIVHESVKLPQHVSIEAGAVIGENVRLGEHCYIGANAVIDRQVRLGENCYIYPNVSILWGCELGNECVVRSGAVIGADGFGHALDSQAECWHAIYHKGKVTLGNNVDVGVSSSIDRGTVNDTHIADGVRMGSLVHIGHDCNIGKNTIIGPYSGVAGYVKLGKNTRVSPYCSFVVPNIEIADNNAFLSYAMVTRSIRETGQTYAGGGGKAAKLFSEFVKEIKNVRRLINKNK